MAMIIRGHSRCAICGSTDLDRPFLATSGCAFPQGHELWRFCDAPLHLECLARWEHRVPFSLGYFDSAREDTLGGYGLLLADGEGWLFRCGPSVPEGLRVPGPPVRAGEPYFAEVLLAEWPKVLYARWNEWPEYAVEGFRRGLVGEALQAVEAVMEHVWPLVPDMDALNELRRQALSRASASPSRT